MKSRTLTCITAMTLFAALVAPLQLAAQEHTTHFRHYKLIDIGTFGGPTSGVDEPSFATDPSRQINVREMVGASATSIPTTATSSPFDCGALFVNHAFVWRMGMVIDLGTLPGVANCSGAMTINSQGVIVGHSDTGEIDPLEGFTQSHAAQWRDGHITDLGSLSGGYESVAVSINNQGLVVGISTNRISDPLGCFGLGVQCRAVRWRNDLIQDMGTLGGPEAVAFLINEQGEIAGAANTNSSLSPGCGNLIFLARTTDPFLWGNGKMRDLGNLGGTCAFPLGLNNRGQVVGVSTLPGDLTIHAFLWPGADGKMQDLGTLGGSFSQANAINEAGEVVGYAGDNRGQVVAFLWKKGAMTNLGFLEGDCASTAQSVNSKGQIVGYSSTACDFSAVRRAVLWEDGSIVDLNTLVPEGSGIQVTLAETINNRGEIAANGAPSGCEVVENCGHALLLIPCDDNHRDIDGCDYSLVDASATAADRPTPTQRPTANPWVSGTANPMMRFFGHRSMPWYHNLGVQPPPK